MFAACDNPEELRTKGIIVDVEGPNNTTKYASSEGGEIIFEFMSNAECEVVIPVEAQDWISVLSMSCLEDKQTVILSLEPNEGYDRGVAVTVWTLDRATSLKYKVKQYGEKGANPSNVPQNEVWYTSADGKIVNIKDDFRKDNFKVKVISNVYENGRGIIKLDGKFTYIASAFAGCSNLKSVIIPNSVTMIGDQAFDDCISLESVAIPSSVIRIGNQTFRNCSSLESITIPNSVTFIGSETFKGCSSLKCVTIPNSVKEVYGDTFSDCISLVV